MCCFSIDGIAAHQVCALCALQRTLSTAGEIAKVIYDCLQLTKKATDRAVGAVSNLLQAIRGSLHAMLLTSARLVGGVCVRLSGAYRDPEAREAVRGVRPEEVDGVLGYVPSPRLRFWARAVTAQSCPLSSPMACAGTAICTHTDEVARFLKHFQNSTRQIQNICAHGKVWVASQPPFPQRAHTPTHQSHV